MMKMWKSCLECKELFRKKNMGSSDVDPKEMEVFFPPSILYLADIKEAFNENNLDWLCSQVKIQSP